MTRRSYIYILSIFLLFNLSILCFFWFPYSDSFWRDCDLKGKVEKEIFQRALDGKRKISLFSKTIVIIDFSKPSIQKRFYVVDLWRKKIVFETYVAHGKGSGENYATEFSNENESHKSSLGFYKTTHTYFGKHGYSLRLKGLEKGINDNAETRAIVVHGAKYVSERFIQKNDRLGRSYGCPALPLEITKEVIDEIKNGVCVYIHAEDSIYRGQTKF